MWDDLSKLKVLELPKCFERRFKFNFYIALLDTFSVKNAPDMPNARMMDAKWGFCKDSDMTSNSERVQSFEHE